MTGSIGDLTPERTPTAAFLTVAAMALIGLIDNYVRLIAGEAGLWQFHLMRTAVALPLIAGVARLLGWRLLPLRPLPVLGRSLFISGSMLLYFGCLALLPIGQVVAGLFTAPIFVALISAMFYGTRIRPMQIVAVGLGFAGILLILRLDAGSLSLLSLMPVLAGLFYAIGNIATRQWCRGENALTLLFGFFGFMGLWGGLGLTLLAVWPQAVAEGADGFILRGWVAPSGLFLGLVLMQAVGAIIGVWMIVRAYQIAEAPRVAVFENTLLVFAAVWAWLLWGETLDLTALAGMAAIGLAGVLIAMAPEGQG